MQTLVQNQRRQMAAKAHKVALRSSLTERNNTHAARKGINSLASHVTHLEPSALLPQTPV